MPESTAADMHRIVEDQADQEVGIPVLLFTTATLAARPVSDGSTATATAQAAIVRVSDTAARLRLDLTDLQLFSADAYLLQTALGESADQVLT